jgi:hypothetical protein
MPSTLLWVGADGAGLYDPTQWLSISGPNGAGQHQAPTAADTMVFDPETSVMDTPGSNGSPSGSLSGNQAGVTTSPFYKGTVPVTRGNTVTITGSLVVQGGTVGGEGSIVLDTGSAGTSVFGSMFPGANPDLDPVQITVKSGSEFDVRGPGSFSATLFNYGLFALQAGGQPYTLDGPWGTQNWNTVDVQGDVSFGNARYVFQNNGLFQKSGGSGVTTFSGQLQNAGYFWLLSGNVTLTGAQSYQKPKASVKGPETQLNGGSLTVTQPYLILGGYLDGVGTITGDILNGDPTNPQGPAGTVHPGLPISGLFPGSGGQLNIVGTYYQGPNGTLWIDVTGSGSGIGVLNVQGTADVGGNVYVYRKNDYTPISGQLNFLQFQTGAFTFGVEIVNNGWFVDQSHFQFVVGSNTNAYYLLVE